MSVINYQMLIPVSVPLTYTAWDPAKCSVDITLTNHRLTGNADGTTTGTPSCVLSVTGKSVGKWYCEVKLEGGVAGFDSLFGIADISTDLNNYVGHDTHSWGYDSGNGKTFHNASIGLSYSIYGTGDIIGIALDMDNGKLYFARNNTWQGSSDPVAGTNPAYTGLSGTIYFAAGSGTTAIVNFTANFGPSFHYTAPTGYIGMT